MSFLDIHVELAVTNELLKRIADALDRAIPLVAPFDHAKHPLIGLSDISRFDPAKATQPNQNRATMPFRASERVGTSHTDRPTGEGGAGTSTSVTGAWDHDDPLDTFEEFGEGWPNYSGVDR